MNIVRLLLLLAAIWIVWRLLRGTGIWRSPQQGSAEPQKPPQQDFEPMARCAGCGTYLPEKALSSNGRCGRCNE